MANHLTTPKVMANDALVQEVLAGLTVYASRYELPEISTPLESVIGSLLNVKTHGANQALPPGQIDPIIQTVKSAFNSDAIGEAILDRSKPALAEQAYRWRQSLEQDVESVLNAYLQQYDPQVTTDLVRDMVVAVAPMVKSGQATKPEVIGLAEQMVQIFTSGSALSTGVTATSLTLAQELAKVFSQKDTEAAVSETVTAYVEKFAPTAEAVSESLIENALGAILKNQVEFNINTDLSLADKRLMIQQVSFKWNIMRQSPKPSKPAWAMAEELNAEVERFNAERRRQLGTPDASAGNLSSDGLSISSHWAFTDRPASGDATEE